MLVIVLITMGPVWLDVIKIKVQSAGAVMGP
jgi:hypothetical protein